MPSRKSGDEFDRRRPDGPYFEIWDAIARMQRESKDVIGRFQKDLDAMFRKHCMAVEAIMAQALERGDRRLASDAKDEPERPTKVDFDFPRYGGDPFHEIRQFFAQIQHDFEVAADPFKKDGVDALLEERREQLDALLREQMAILGLKGLPRGMPPNLPKRPRRKPPRKGGSEPVTVEPNRPKTGEGGAAAPLEFDE